MVVLATISVSYDFRVSNRRRKKYGASSELNPLVPRLATYVGHQNAMLAGTLVPHAMLTIVALALDWRLGYALYTGWVCKQAMMQLASLVLEQEIDAAIGAMKRFNPPSAPVEPGRGPDTSETPEGK